ESARASAALSPAPAPTINAVLNFSWGMDPPSRTCEHTRIKYVKVRKHGYSATPRFRSWLQGPVDRAPRHSGRGQALLPYGGRHRFSLSGPRLREGVST